jgi:hypothetical protein
LSINFQQSIKNSDQNQIDQTEYKKYRNKFQELLNLKATGKELEEDDIIFIKAAKKEFDPFCYDDEKQEDVLKEKQEDGNIKEEIDLLNFINIDNQFDPIENLNSLKTNAENLNPIKYKKQINLITKIIEHS